MNKTKTIEIVDALLADAGLTTYSEFLNSQLGVKEAQPVIEYAHLPDGTRVKAIEHQGCSGCIADDGFYSRYCGNIDSGCEGSRTDGKSVIWVRAE
jgi:hypothetical protein